MPYEEELTADEVVSVDDEPILDPRVMEPHTAPSRFIDPREGSTPAPFKPFQRQPFKPFMAVTGDDVVQEDLSADDVVSVDDTPVIPRKRVSKKTPAPQRAPIAVGHKSSRSSPVPIAVGHRQSTSTPTPRTPQGAYYNLQETTAALKDKRNFVSPEIKTRREGMLGGRPTELANQFANSISNIIASLPQNVAETLDYFMNTPRVTPTEGVVLPQGRFSAAQTVKPYTQQAKTGIDRTFPLDPQYEGDLVMQGLPQVGASVASFMGGGLAGKALKIPGMMTAAGLGALMNVGEVAEEIENRGIDPARRNIAIAAALATGLTETAGLGRLIDKFGMKRPLTAKLMGLLEEGGQEVAQGWLNNLNAAYIGEYEKGRPLTKDWLQNFILGTAGGVMGEGMGSALGKLGKAGRALNAKRQQPLPPDQWQELPEPYSVDAWTRRPKSEGTLEVPVAKGAPLPPMSPIERPDEYSVIVPAPAKDETPYAIPGPGGLRLRDQIRNRDLERLQEEERLTSIGALSPSLARTRANLGPMADAVIGLAKESVNDPDPAKEQIYNNAWNLLKQAEISKKPINTDGLFPQPQPYGEAEEPAKVGLKGRRPRTPDPSDTYSPVDVGEVIPIPPRPEIGSIEEAVGISPFHGEAPNQYPLTDMMREKARTSQATMTNHDPVTGLPLDDVNVDLKAQRETEGDPASAFAAGADRSIDTPTGPVTTSEIHSKAGFSELGSTTTSDTHTLRLPGPGGTNFEEIAVTAPDHAANFTKPEHYGDTKNVLFDIAVEDRPLLEGGKGTLLSSAQSDWAQDKENKASHPFRNNWLGKALDRAITEAQRRGTQGVLLPHTPDQIAEIQKFGRLTERDGKYYNAQGFEVTPIIRRYVKEMAAEAEKAARRLDVKVEQRTVDIGQGDKASMLFIPVDQSFLNAQDRQDDSTSSRQTNAKRFVENADPRLKKSDGSPRDLYHGTQSPTEITELDETKLDSNALYGPGFYMTQDAGVAAGEGGYATSKAPPLESVETLKRVLAENFSRRLIDGGIPYSVEEALAHLEAGTVWESFNLRKVEDELAAKGVDVHEGHKFLTLYEAKEQSNRDYSDWKAGRARPHAYKLYTNITNPFDIDATIPGEKVDEILSDITGRPIAGSSSRGGDELYRNWFIEAAGGDKAKVNAALRKAGYDGITHIGGQTTQPKIYQDQQEAQQEADATGGKMEKVGAEVVEITTPDFKTHYRLELTGTGQSDQYMRGGGNHILEFDTAEAAQEYADSKDLGIYTVHGHRVWIAFNKNQVKSATGNTGEFNPDTDNISNKLDAEGFPEDGDFPLPDPFAPKHPYDKWMTVVGPSGGAPVLYVPSWAYVPYEDYKKSKIFGTHLGADKVGRFGLALANMFSGDYKQQILDNFTKAIEAMEQEGAQSVILINAGHDLVTKKGTITHEFTHAGQQEIGGRGSNIAQIHDTNWALNHPILKKAMQGERAKEITVVLPDGITAHDLVAMEMPAYFSDGTPGALFGLTDAEAAQYTADYIEHLVDVHGDRAIEVMGKYSGHTKAIGGAISTAKERIDAKRRDRVSKRLTNNPTLARALGLAGASGDVSGSDSQGVQSPTGEGIGEDVSGDTPTGSTGRDGKPPTPPTFDALEMADSSDPVFKDEVDPQYTQLSARAFIQALKEGNINYDHTLPPFLQLHKALRDGKLQPARLAEILDEHGVPYTQFVEALKETASDAGKTLAEYSRIKGYWNQLLRDDPELAKKIVPPSYQIAAARKNLNNSVLSRTWWERSGGTLQKMMLTELATTAVNTMTTVGRIPLEIATQGVAAKLQTLDQGQGSLMERMRKDSDIAIDAAKATWEVARALSPKQLREISRKPGGGFTKSGHYEEMDNIVRQFELVFPDLRRKLHGLSMGPESLGSGEKDLANLKTLVNTVKDEKKRKELIREIDTAEKRLQSHKRGLHKAISLIDKPYDQMLRPMQFAEYLLRRPMFVGQLRAELQRQGLDMEDLLAQGKDEIAKKVSKETITYAVNKALELTFAYMPAKENGAMEAVGEYAIKGLNAMGPIATVAGEPFAKAMYNGLKFMYEWAPWGMVAPTLKRASGRQLYDPLSKKFFEKTPMKYQDYERLAKGLMGSLMYAVAWGLLDKYRGDEWFMIKTGRKDKDGREIQVNVSRFHPFSDVLHLTDVMKANMEGRARDRKFGDEVMEVFTGIKRSEGGAGIFDWANSTADYWGGEETGARGDASLEGAGRLLGIPLTPLGNLRDMVAQFYDPANRKKDLRGEGLRGPALEKIPFMRDRLPNLTSPVMPSPIKLSEDPMVSQLSGYKENLAKNFAGREWSRLGIMNKTFLTRDPNPVVNRAQNEFFQKLTDSFGKKWENDPTYLALDDKQKLARWEMVIDGVPSLGIKGIAQAAREVGEAAAPREKGARDAQQKMPGKFQQEAMGLDKILKRLRGEQ